MDKMCSCGCEMVDFGESIRGLRGEEPVMVTKPAVNGREYGSMASLVYHKTVKSFSILFGKEVSREVSKSLVFNPRFRVCPKCGKIEQYVDEETLKYLMERYKE